MSNRMSVLSRRLGRFAACFSAITFCFLLVGLYANANNQGQALVFVAALGLVCFFAAFFLWLAHGFAWAMIPENPAGAKKPAVMMTSAEVLQPQEAMKPVESMKPIESMKDAETLKPAPAMKAVEEKVITPKDSPDAKYTITGRRIL